MTIYGILVTVICIALLALNYALWVENEGLRAQLPKRVNGRFVKRT